MTTPRKRNRASAKGAGRQFENDIAGYLNRHVDSRIERRRQAGAKDRGDITGLHHLTERVVVECKNVARPALAKWAEEAEVARGNDDANAAVVAHKRHGVADPAQQWITMTLQEFVALLMGNREHVDEE